MAASRGETEELRQWLDFLEECYEALSRAALDLVGILGTGGLLLLDRLRGIPDFAGAAGFIAAEVSISNLLEKGANRDEAIS